MKKPMNIPKSQAPVIRRYSSLAGVDLSRLPSQVASFRSPDAKNVYKDYRTSGAPAVQSRPGFKKAAKASGKIYGIHVLGSKTLIHHGSVLSLASGFPSETAFTDFPVTMNESRSESFVFGGKLYILDGLNYLVYNGTALSDVKNAAYVPTTKISSSPDGGKAQFYQDVNYLTPLRKNSFCADGVSRTYKLDAASFDDELPRVWINGTEMTGGFSYDSGSGSVTFEQAPASPLTEGTDNVVIQFSKTVNGYEERIKGCSIACVFDNRVFLSGNNGFKGVVFHSELDDPTYFSDESWYDDGADMCEVKALIPSSQMLTVVKNAYPSSESSKVYFHTPSLNYDAGKVYPCSDAGINTGCIAAGALFGDDIVFISPDGLEGVSISSQKARLHHRSGNIDAALVNDGALVNASIKIWRNYLCILTEGRMYLADSFQRFTNEGSNEYEWYLWEDIGVYDAGGFKAACLLKTIGDKLYFGCENGCVCVFEGTNDDGRAINAYWCMPEDIFSSLSHFKTTNRRGGAAIVKRIPNSLIKIATSTDRESFADVCESKTSGFGFEQVDFASFSFGTGVRGLVTFGIKKKKIWHFQLKFYSDEKDKPFGIYEACIEAFIGNYIK